MPPRYRPRCPAPGSAPWPGAGRTPGRSGGDRHPNDTHAPIAREALLAGKHVVIDKPFALDLAEGEGAGRVGGEAAAAAQHLPQPALGRGLSHRAPPAGRGALGQVAQFESHFDRYRPEVRQRWREAGGPGSGLWFDLGPTSSISRSSCSVSRTGCRRIWASSAPAPWRRLLPCGAGLWRDAGHSARQLSGVGHHAPFRHPRQSMAPSSSSAWTCRRSSSRRGKRPPAADWGVDQRPGQLSQIRDGQLLQQRRGWRGGDYGAYYRGVCAAIRGRRQPGAGRRGSGGDGLAGPGPGERPAGAAPALSEAV